MSDLFGHAEGATPLDEEAGRGLLQDWITTRAELNEAEQANIQAGNRWALRTKKEILAEPFIRELHRRMFGDVWEWAGSYRLNQTNIGIAPYRIPVEVRIVLDDVKYWVTEASYPNDEVAVRLHHRLVLVHPFRNGNGRHARLMADLLIMLLGSGRFSWGSANLANEGVVRADYLEALKRADEHDIKPLLEFART